MNTPDQDASRPIVGPNNVGVEIHIINEEDTTAAVVTDRFREWLAKHYGPTAPPSPPPSDK